MSRRLLLLAAALSFAFASVAQEADRTAEFEKAVYFGAQYFGLKDYASAYEQFAKADQLRPDQPPVLYNMAMLLSRSGRLDEAQAVVERYLKLESPGPERLLVNQLQLQLEFQRDLQRTRRIEQEYSELFNRGRILYGRNDLAEALKLFAEAEKLRNREPAAVFNQAVILEKMGDFEKATARYRRYLELETDSLLKNVIGQRVVMLDLELDEMRSKMVCSFCGHRLEPGATWCHRCWHGPYSTTSAALESRACSSGASVSRATYRVADRPEKEEPLSCLFETSLREALRYSPARQRAIQDARKAEGWSYDGEVIQSWADTDGNSVRYVQGPEALERIEASSGAILEFESHKAGSLFLLDREEWVVDGIVYASRFRFDDAGRILQQVVTYQNGAACNHLIEMTADYEWGGSRLVGAKIRGGYTGFAAEGSPRTDWVVTIANSFDGEGHLLKEDLNVDSFTKTYAAKPQKGEREIVSALYPGMRVKKPVADLARSGDLCGVQQGKRVANLIDLRPFYAISPNLAIALPEGVTRATVTHTRP